MHARHPATLVILAAAFVPGCISPQNDRIVIDRDLRLDAFTPVSPRPATPELAPSAVALQQPSLTGLDRGNWEPTPFIVPVDGTAHNPTYSHRVVIADATARQRREYPTALTALEVTGGSEWHQQLEAPANWLASFLDPIILIPAMFFQAPWTARWSPTEAYVRYWHPERPGQLPLDDEAPSDGPFIDPIPLPVTP